MTTTTANAVDEMFAVVRAALTGFAGLDIRWPGIVYPVAPVATASFVLVTLKHLDGGQASLACYNGRRRWERIGRLTVQCFAPLQFGGMQKAGEMAVAVRDAMQGASTPGGVWFRDATTNEVGPDASWYQTNAASTFNYDEVR